MSIEREVLDLASRAFLGAAKHVLKEMKHAESVKGALVGGTAVDHLVPNYRGTRDVDIQISGLSALDGKYDRQRLVRDIVKHCNPKAPAIPTWTANASAVCGLTYRLVREGRSPKYVQIDVLDRAVNGWQIATSKVLLQLEETRGALPYAGRDDVLCTKAMSAFNRYNDGDVKAKQDVLDMKMIIDRTKTTPVKGNTNIAHLQKYVPRIYDIARDQTNWGLKDWATALGIELKYYAKPAAKSAAKPVGQSSGQKKK